MKYDVFISYSRADYVAPNGKILKNSIVLKIKKMLTENGISFWFDEEGIYSGDAFASKIAKNIKNARIFLFISTENANKSEWTSKEIAVAHAYKKKIIPFRYDQSLYHESVIIYLADLDFIDYQFNRQKAMKRLVAAIKEYLQNNPEPHTHHTHVSKTLSEITSVEMLLADTSSVDTPLSPPPPAPKRYGWIKWCVAAILLLVLGVVGVKHTQQYKVEKSDSEATEGKYLKDFFEQLKNEKHGQSKSLPQEHKVEGVAFTMIKVQGGTFQMGATPEQTTKEYTDSLIRVIQTSENVDKKISIEKVMQLFANETPVHEVILSDYYIGETEVTQALWEAVMGDNPSKHVGKNMPVDKVSWDDCQEFIRRLNEKTRKTFRLPTEAEWEYAARGGNKSNGYRYSGSHVLDSVGWYAANSGNTLHDVATKKPNELGIYDMNGNVWEWCLDWYDSDYYDYRIFGINRENPTGVTKGNRRVLRGGSWHGNSTYCRVAVRNSELPTYNSDSIGGNLGLRLAMDP